MCCKNKENRKINRNEFLSVLKKKLCAEKKNIQLEKISRGSKIEKRKNIYQFLPPVLIHPIAVRLEQAI